MEEKCEGSLFPEEMMVMAKEIFRKKIEKTAQSNIVQDAIEMIQLSLTTQTGKEYTILE